MLGEDIERQQAGQRGMSLVEATIILMVLAILTAVMAPAVGDYVNDAKGTKAHEDVEAVGMGIERLVRDTGFSCLTSNPQATGSSPTNQPCGTVSRIDLLISNGNTPTVSAADTTFPSSSAATTTGNWLGGTTPIQANNRDTMDHQLVTNLNGAGSGPLYTNASYSTGASPRPGLGWRGAYITGPLGPDPWGYVYQANTIYLTVASNATGSTEGLLNGGWKSDVVVITGGANGTVETLFSSADTVGQSGTIAVGDDILYVVRGSTR